MLPRNYYHCIDDTEKEVHGDGRSENPPECVRGPLTECDDNHCIFLSLFTLQEKYTSVNDETQAESPEMNASNPCDRAGGKITA
jgi:hypothetical protein